MSEKLVKIFSRDVSLFFIQWWDEAITQSFKKDFRVSYTDQAFVGNGLTITCFGLEKAAGETQDAVCEKIASDPGYYLAGSKKFRENVAELKRVIAAMEKKPRMDLAAFEGLKNSFQRIYPTFRMAIKIPTDWSETLKAMVPDSADELISTAFEDRKQSEGLFEIVDSVAQRLVKQNLRDLDKPEGLSKFLSDEDLRKLVLGQEPNWFEVLSREQGFVYSVNRIFAGSDYLPAFKKMGYEYSDDAVVGNSVKGNVAFAGSVVRGTARVIFSLDQLASFKQGEVLITPMTGPDFVPAMKKASAIVTDEGGITCHAAIVSRELQVPCIVGTKHATRMFQNGDFVEVDAFNGLIRKVE